MALLIEGNFLTLSRIVTDWRCEGGISTYSGACYIGCLFLLYECQFCWFLFCRCWSVLSVACDYSQQCREQKSSLNNLWMPESGWRAIKTCFKGADVSLLKDRPIVVVLFNVAILVCALCILIYACKLIEGAQCSSSINLFVIHRFYWRKELHWGVVEMLLQFSFIV